MSLKPVSSLAHDGRMKAIMKLEDLKTVAQLEDFLSGTQDVAFAISNDKDERYRWIEGELVRFQYLLISRQQKGVVLRYIMKISGYSRQQLTRLVSQYRRSGVLKRRQHTASGFAKKYSDADVHLLAKMDERHDSPCGPAIKKLCERAFQVFSQEEYASLASISVSHIYNLRKSRTYTRQRQYFAKTRSRASSIGERRKPRPNGRPGYIRIDTVHQGDLDGHKGVYHINAVDEVTQFEVVCSLTAHAI